MILVNVQQILQSLKKHVTFAMIVYIVKFVQLKTFVKHVMILLKLIMELVLVLPLQLFSIVLVLLVIFPIVKFVNKQTFVPHVKINLLNLIMFVYLAILILVLLVAVKIIVPNVKQDYKLIPKEIFVLHVLIITVKNAHLIIYVQHVLKAFNLIQIILNALIVLMYLDVNIVQLIMFVNNASKDSIYLVDNVPSAVILVKLVIVMELVLHVKVHSH